jgi:beta-phosphoglucomutase
MISSLIFDLDGTLFDSSEANVKAYSLAFQAVGLELDVERYRQLFGLRFSEMMDAIAPAADEATRQKIRSAKAEHYQANLQLVQPNAGLLAFVESAKPHCSTALVTTASRKNVEALLEKFLPGQRLFDQVVVGEDVKQGKPDPECYLLAASKLAASPKQCLVFEDSEVGLEAARRAGMQTVRIAL